MESQTFSFCGKNSGKNKWVLMKFAYHFPVFAYGTPYEFLIIKE